jgi:F420-non-reducing hydrogenase iron-sulfur subunit
VEYTKELLREIGLEPDRLEMFHIGASDAPAWAGAVTEMTERAKMLGPNPLKKIFRIAEKDERETIG